jgi:hypothetical protein
MTGSPCVVYRKAKNSQTPVVPYIQLKPEVKVRMCRITKMTVTFRVFFQFIPKLVEYSDKGLTAQTETGYGTTDFGAYDKVVAHRITP